jgi:WD40 repeat protein/tetratricopeptide (TPR) repeat protein
VWLWNAQDKNGSPVKLGAHGREVAHVEFSGSGDRLASSCWDGLINVWPLAGGAARATFRGHDGAVYFATFARADLSGGYDKTVRHWALLDGPGTPVELSAHPGSIESIAFNLTGSAATDDDVSPEVRLWDMTDFERAPAVLTGHETGIAAASYTLDGKRIVSADVDGKVIIRVASPPYTQQSSFNVFYRDPSRPHTKQHPLSVPSRITSLSVSPNGSILAIGCTAHAERERGSGVTLWSKNKNSTGKVFLRDPAATDGRVIAELEFYGHCQAVAISRDNRWLAIGRQGWQLETLPVLLFQLGDTKAKPIEFASDLKGPVRGLAFSQDGKWLAAGTSWLHNQSTREITDGRVLLWDMTGFDGRTTPRRIELNGGEGAVAALGFSPTEPVLAAGTQSGTVLLFDLTRPTARPALLRHHKYPVRSVAVHPDGKSLLSGDARGGLFLWRTMSDLFDESGRRVSRNLTWDEWREFVGTDLPYEKTCDHLPAHPTVITALKNEAKSAGIPEALAAVDPSLHPEVKPRVADALRAEVNEGLGRWQDPNSRRTVADHERESAPDLYDARLVLAQELDPKHATDPKADAERLCGRSLLDRGRALITSWRGEDIPGALRLLRRSRELAPALSDLPAEKEVAKLLLDHIRWKADGGRFAPRQLVSFDEVEKLLHEAARLDATIDVAAQLRALKAGRSHAHADDAVFWLDRMTVSSTESGIADLTKGAPLLEKSPAALTERTDWPEFLYLANRLAQEDKLAETIAAFKKAKEQNQAIKYDAAKMGRLAVAVHRLARAKQEAAKGDVGLAIKAFQSIESQFPEITLHQVHWNALCWDGSLRGRAKEVLFAGEKAVALEERGNREPYVDYGLDLADYRDTRGVARALTGDFNGAISDFEYFVANHGAIKTIRTDEAAVANARKLRQKWIDQLKNNAQPFTDEVLAQLLSG